MMKFNIQLAQSTVDYTHAKALFLEYAESMDFNFCFDSLEAELAQLVQLYTAPDSGILLLRKEQAVVGCVAWTKRAKGIAELRRMYIQPTQRGQGQGRLLLQQAVQHIKAAAYERIYLETVEGKMDAAIRMYEKLDFKKIKKTSSNCALTMELVF